MEEYVDAKGEIPLDETAARALLVRQRLFVKSGLRASVQGLRKLQSAGQIWNGALENVAPVGILIKESEMVRAASALTTSQDFIEAALFPYGPNPRNLRVEDHLYHEFAWGTVEGMMGTCCLIDPERVITAKHCIERGKDDKPIFDGLHVVFGFQTATDGYPNRIFHRASSVFRVVAEGPHGTGGALSEDWTTLILEAPAIGVWRAPVTIAPHAGSLSDGVYTLGHPNGLCMRFSYSPSAPAIEGDPGCYYAFVDGFNGASGSPVFDAITHQLVGILVMKNGSNRGVVNTEARDNLSPVTGPGDISSATLFIDSISFAARI